MSQKSFTIQYIDMPDISYSLQLIAIGSLTQRKGFERLIHAVHELVKEGIDCGLWILGEGPEKDRLKRIIKESSLSERIKLLGYKTNPYPYIAHSDVYVCSSFAEGYNTAISESLVLGKPIVSTDCSGVREQLGDSEYGIVVNNDSTSLLEGLRLLVSDASMRHSLSGRALERGKKFIAADIVKYIENAIIEECTFS